MQKQRPIGVTLFVVWSLAAGIFIISYGAGLLMDGLQGYGNGQGGDLLSQGWLPYFAAYVLVGAVWTLGSLAYWFGAFKLYFADGLGRTVSIIAIIAISVGWVIIKIISLSFKGPLPLIGVIILLPMLYLWAGEVREYCEGG